MLTLFIGFKEKNAQLIAAIECSASTSEEPKTQSPLYIEFHELLAGLFKEMSAKKGLSEQDRVFRTDMLMTALSSRSYLFQRKVRGSSPELILEQLCQMFI